ncbi:FHA domain protein (macronuclear) [Tetrahymena thermophila SB210]|uniref:FHA domain protein n=1 Tax=Tetrahymena thermophila (strain SB210) TaxID=312017 RepID=I7MCY0_TETTS|nr:FHA domain protein [Tetrahymena thermophila SB210]EAR85128.1 FHA domain protein [Tetrahymena thermophila SB210]|eukprot:XP_001032791.1 FHA domain protein [Tetrahymena thermophila SB210]
MGNCQNICQLGLTTESPEQGQDLEKYFLGQRQQSRIQNAKDGINLEQIKQKNQQEYNQSLSIGTNASKAYNSQRDDIITTNKESNDAINNLNNKLNPAQKFVKIKTTIWNKDSHSLFDYENNDNKQSIFKIKSSGTLTLSKDQIVYRKKNKKYIGQINGENIQANQNANNGKNNSEVDLFKVHYECGRFFLQQTFDSEMRPSQQSSWIVIKSVQNQRKKGFRLIENDFIKLGRLKFKVREICESGKKVQTQIKKIIEEQTEFVSEQEGITEMLTIRSAKNLEEFQLKPNSNILNSLNNPTNKNTTTNPQQQAFVQQLSNFKQKYEEQGTNCSQLQCFTKEGTYPNIPSKGDLGKDITNNTNMSNNNNIEGGFVPMCKICLSEQADSDNPFVNPCKCTGSMKFVHIKCIQYWVRSKIQSSYQNQNCIVLLSKFFECELCKTKYHFKFNSEGQIYDIVDYSKPEDGSPYLILEAYTGSKLQSFGVYILKLSGKNHFTIGRAHDADIRVSDISVSRQHAQLTYDSETHQLYIKDRESKFGSLVMMRDDLEITQDLDRIQIQNGRTLLEIIYDRNQRGIFSSCLGGSNENEGIEVISEEEDDEDRSFDTQYQDI